MVELVDKDNKSYNDIAYVQEALEKIKYIKRRYEDISLKFKIRCKTIRN